MLLYDEYKSKQLQTVWHLNIIFQVQQVTYKKTNVSACEIQNGRRLLEKYNTNCTFQLYMCLKNFKTFTIPTVIADITEFGYKN